MKEMVIINPAEATQRLKGIIREAGHVKRKRGNQRTRKRVRYVNILTAFDIETTYLSDIDQSFMYVWQWHFHGYFTVVGRTWDEFLDVLDCITHSTASPIDKIVCYIHNLSYEFQFLAGIFMFEQKDVFAVDARKILRATMGCVELRCSYLHSNMSLDEYTRKMGVAHLKLSYDYAKIRYSWTPLSDDEIAYCINDVIGLCEALIVEMEHDGDDLYTIPLTSTGYVRRDMKNAIRSAGIRFPHDLFPDTDLYLLLRDAFRGGNTHANRYYVGKILHNVKSADRSSSYPDVICNYEYPITPFQKINECTLTDAIRLNKRRHKALVMRIACANIRLRDDTYPIPYLSDSKCVTSNAAIDNGRVLHADYLQTAITDIDLEIILRQYDFDDIVLSDVYASTYGKLPQPIIDTTIGYYHAKTALKNVPGEEIFYLKSKNKINAIYGMTAQDPCKISYLYMAGEFVREFELSDRDALNGKIADYQHNGFLPYQWGVWTTAWARWTLEEGIMAAGDGVVYVDTDSVKYVGDFDIDKFNARAMELSAQSGAHAADQKNVDHYMGIYEQERPYKRFITWGAKKYAYEYADDDLHITIAGVGKTAGAAELKAAGGLEALKPGFVFTDINKLTHTYNDIPPIDHITVDGHVQQITRNVALSPTTYKFGISAEFESLLDGINNDMLMNFFVK